MNCITARALAFLVAVSYVHMGAAQQLFRLPPVNQTPVVLGFVEQSNWLVRSQGPIAQPSSAAEAGFDQGLTECCDGEPFWVHRNGVFAEFMYMRARDAEVAYAVPIDGPVAQNVVPVQIGPTGVVDPQFEPAFRVGWARALDDCSSLMLTYSHFESNTSDAISVITGDLVRSIVTHPSSANSSTDGLTADARLGIDFDLIDLDYRRLFSGGDQHVVNYLVGVRYAHLDQNFNSQFANLGRGMVDTNVGFDGVGVRLGLDGERHACNSGLLCYGRGTVSFVAGEFRANYNQRDTIAAFNIDSGWKAGRVMTMLDLELGVGWENQSGTLRWTVGYLFSSWNNVVKTDDVIQAVRTNNFLDLGDDILSFDGLTTRLEYRF